MPMPRPDATDKLRVLIVEDEDLYRDLLSVALSHEGSFDVIGAFADGETALEAAPRLEPHVAILDIELGRDPNGIQVGLRLRRQLPDLGIILLSNHGDPHFLSSLPREAISGWSYLLKKTVSDLSCLKRAIEGATAGFVVLDPQIVTGMQPKMGGLLSRLTPRQNEILMLIAQGYTNAGIAQKLMLSEKSVENQINSIYQQLDVGRDDASLQPRVVAVLTYLRESRPGRLMSPSLGTDVSTRSRGLPPRA